MTEECSKYGAVAAIEIPHVGGPGAGVGFVFVKYGTREDAQKVCTACLPYERRERGRCCGVWRTYLLIAFFFVLFFVTAAALLQ